MFSPSCLVSAAGGNDVVGVGRQGQFPLGLDRGQAAGQGSLHIGVGVAAQQQPLGRRLLGGGVDDCLGDFDRVAGGDGGSGAAGEVLAYLPDRAVGVGVDLRGEGGAGAAELGAPAAVGAQVRDDRAGELDRASQIGVDLVGDLLVGELLGGAEQPVPCVRDHHVDSAELGERGVDHLADLCGVADVQLRGPQLVAVLGGQVGEGLGTAGGGGNAVATREQDFGQVATKSTGGSSDEPGL